MALRKTAIAIPRELLTAVDRTARERHETRNRFVTIVLERAVRAHRDVEISLRLNQLFESPDLAKAQRSAAADLDAAGTNWADERW